MKLRYQLLVSLLAFASSALILDADSSEPSKKDNAKKEEKQEDKKKNEGEDKEKEKEKPKTEEVKKKHIRIELSLKGYFEDPDAIPISISTKNWSELKVTTPPIQGKKVKKCEPLLKFELEKIKQRLDSLNSDLSVIDLDREMLTPEFILADTLASMEKKELHRM